MDNQYLDIIEKETEAKIASIIQLVTHACNYYEKKGATQLDQLSPEIKQLPVEQFQTSHKETFESFVRDLHLKRLSEFELERMKEAENEIEEDNCIDSELLVDREEYAYIDSELPIDREDDDYIDSELPVHREGDDYIDSKLPIYQYDDDYIDSELPLDREKVKQRENTSNMGPLFILLERKDRSNISLKLDPNKSVHELGKYNLVAPDNIMWQLEDKTHRQRVWDQVEDIKSQLEMFQEHLLKKRGT